MDNETYRVVYRATGEPYEGTLSPGTDREALVQAMAEIMEISPFWRGKLEVRP